MAAPAPPAPRPVDRSAAVTLLSLHAAGLVVCGGLSGVVTGLWAAMLVAALLDPTSPQALSWMLGGAIVLRLAGVLGAGANTVLALAAAASLRRGEPRFVAVAAVASMVVPTFQLLVGMMTFDMTSCAWVVPTVLGIVAGVVALMSMVGTAPAQRDEW
jgi:hypothetical protein